MRAVRGEKKERWKLGRGSDVEKGKAAGWVCGGSSKEDGWCLQGKHWTRILELKALVLVLGSASIEVHEPARAYWLRAFTRACCMLH